MIVTSYAFIVVRIFPTFFSFFFTISLRNNFSQVLFDAVFPMHLQFLRVFSSLPFLLIAMNGHFEKTGKLLVQLFSRLKWNVSNGCKRSFLDEWFVESVALILTHSQHICSKPTLPIIKLNVLYTVL